MKSLLCVLNGFKAICLEWRRGNFKSGRDFQKGRQTLPFSKGTLIIQLIHRSGSLISNSVQKYVKDLTFF